MAKPLPPQDVLNQYLSYDANTGVLIWNFRRPDCFKTASQFKIWNTRYAGKEAFAATDSRGRRYGRIDSVRYSAHRVIWKMVTGSDALVIDHIDGNPGNNRFGNLRNVTTAENNKNRPAPCATESGQVGVSWRRNEKRWRAHIAVGGRQIHLGFFDDKNDAIRARKAAERAHGFHPNHGRPKHG